MHTGKQRFLYTVPPEFEPYHNLIYFGLGKAPSLLSIVLWIPEFENNLENVYTLRAVGRNCSEESDFCAPCCSAAPPRGWMWCAVLQSLKSSNLNWACLFTWAVIAFFCVKKKTYQINMIVFIGGVSNLLCLFYMF